jgi:hypothetical protein
MANNAQSRINLAKARQAKEEKNRREMEELKRIVAEKKKTVKKDKEVEKKEEPMIIEEKEPVIQAKPVEEKIVTQEPNMEDKKEEEKVIPEPSPKKIEFQDLFIIPPGFFDSLTKGEEEDMKGVTIQPVEKKRVKFDSHKSKHVKKRKRETSEDDEQESESESSQEEERINSRNIKKKRKTSSGLPISSNSTPSPTPKPKGWMDTIGGVYTKIAPHVPVDTTSIRNNVLLGIGSILVIAIRGCLQRHLSGGPIVGTPHQDNPVRVDNAQKANQMMPLVNNVYQSNMMDYANYVK